MRNHRFRHKNHIVRGSILVVLLLTLFTMTSLTALARTQKDQDSRSFQVASLQKAPAGTAELSWNAQSQALTVVLHVEGLQPGSTHAAHIHTGTCSKEGNILYFFNNVVADAAGNGTSTTTLQHVTGGIPATGWDIMIHRGPAAETSPILCGNVVNPNGATSLSVPLCATQAMHKHAMHKKAYKHY